MSRCVLETNVVYRADAHHHTAAKVVARLVDDEVALLLSLVNYA